MNLTYSFLGYLPDELSVQKGYEINVLDVIEIFTGARPNTIEEKVSYLINISD